MHPPKPRQEDQVTRTDLIALSIALFLHPLLVLALGYVIYFKKENTEPEPLVISLVQDTPRVTETNNTANQQRPEKAQFESNRNQRQAQTNPNDKESLIPEMMGKQNDLLRLKTGDWRDSSVASAAQANPQEMTHQTELKEQETETEYTTPINTKGLFVAQQEKEPEELPNEASKEGSPSMMPSPRPRPQVNHARLSGVLYKNPDGGAKKRGKVAIDAEMTPFGEYSLRFQESLDYQFNLIASQYPQLRQLRDASVRLKFTQNSKGEIKDINVIHNSASNIAELVVKQALNNISPTGPWPESMQKRFGRAKRFTVEFKFNA